MSMPMSRHRRGVVQGAWVTAGGGASGGSENVGGPSPPCLQEISIPAVDDFRSREWSNVRETTVRSELNGLVQHHVRQ
jgi:hypothetical protein